MTTEYVSSVGGFIAGEPPNGGPGTPASYYAGALNTLPGFASVAGFHFAALIVLDDRLLTTQGVWSNQTGVAGIGWALQVQPSTVVGAPPNAIDVNAIGAFATAKATVLNAQPGVPMLLHAHSYADVGNGQNRVDLHINGTLAASNNDGAAPYAPSNDAPLVGALGPNATPSDFFTAGRILGVMYHEGALPEDGTPASFYLSCREAKDMAWGSDVAGAPASDFTNRYSVRENISASAVAPATWTPSTGVAPLTRSGTLNVRAHKNLDWLAAMFAEAGGL